MVKHPKVGSGLSDSNVMCLVVERIEAWLRGRQLAVFETIRARGVEMELLPSFWMNVDQTEFRPPPRLLLRLGERGLPFHLISND